MYLEAKETARLYKLLTDKLGSDTTEAMFKYIDNKRVQSVEATIKTLATREDIHDTRGDLRKEISMAKDELYKEIGIVKDNLAKFKYDLSKDISNSIKWMFIFWVGQVGATLAIIFLLLKK